MCFTETQSYINVILLIVGGIFVFPYWRLSVPMFFLACKDLLQGLLYRYIEDKNINNTLTKLSWIHICFQPLFVNMLLSNFSRKKIIYWNVIFTICTIYGLYTITNLNDFDIQNNEDCIKSNKRNNFCSNKTLSYIGKHHVGYRFSRDNEVVFPIIYAILMVLPSLLTSSRTMGIIWLVFVIIIQTIGKYLKLGNGETGAIWCFSSILCILPMGVIYKLTNK